MNEENITTKMKNVRLFFYIKQKAEIDYKTLGEDTNNGSANSLYYFMIPDYFQSSEIILRITNIIIKPDYLTRYRERYKTVYHIVQEKYYISKPEENETLFMVWIRLDQNVLVQEKVYQTLMDVGAHLGAIWSLVFSLLAIYFIHYNQSKFYRDHPDWEDFGTTISGFKTNLQIEDTKKDDDLKKQY